MVTRVGVATGTTTCTVPAHQVGDIIVIFAERNASGTAPSMPATFQAPVNPTKANGAAISGRVGFRIATSTSDASGTWTNASQITCHVYRPAAGCSLFLGAVASSSSTTNTIPYPALTLTHTDGTSWVLGFAAVNNTTETVNTPPAGMTNQSSLVGAATSIAGQDTNGPVSSWSLANATTTGTAGSSISFTVELIENQPGTIINNFVQHIVSSTVSTAAEGTTFDFYNDSINPTLAGNLMLLGASYPSGQTPTITDDQGNAWPASGTVGSTVIADNGAGNMALQIFILTSATTGTSKPQISFGGNPVSPVTWWIDELEGVTGTLSASAHAAGVNANGIVSPGSLTPGSNNCLIIAYMANAATIGTTTPALIVSETGYVLNDADISMKTSGYSKASQYALQTTAAATTPRFYLNAGGTDTYNVVALALTTGSQGTLPATGPGQAPWILKRIHFSSTAVGGPTSWLLQTPSAGNCMAMTSYMSNTGTPNWNGGLVSNDSPTWQFQNPLSGASSGYNTKNSPANPNRTTTVTVSATNQNIQVIYYDIANTDPTNPVVATAAVGSTAEDSRTTSTTNPSITPTGPNQLTLAYMQMGTGPSYSVVTPAGAVFNLPYAYQWQGTGTITGTTTWNSTANTWGTNPVIGQSPNTISQPIIDTTTPGNVPTGATISSPNAGGVAPFTLSNTSTNVVGDTFRLGFDDGNMLAWGNAAGHYYNGSNVSTQNWTWGISNILAAIGNSCSGFAMILQGPAAAGFVAPPELGGPKFGTMLGVPKGPFSLKFFPNSQAFPSAPSTVSLGGYATTQAKAFGQITGTVPLLGSAKTMAELRAQMGAAAALAAKATTQAKASGAMTGTAAMAGRLTTMAKALAGPSGTVPLSGQATTQAKALGAIIFATFLSGRVTTMAKVAAAATGSAALSARATTMVTARAGFSGTVALSGAITTAAKSLGTIGTGGVVALSGLVTTMAKAAGRQAAAVTLAGYLTAQTKAQAASPVAPPAGQFQYITSLGGIFNSGSNSIG